jgi:arabinogalactan endo-1,4-beta-galactosidase
MYDAEIGKEPLLAAIQEIQAEIIYDYNLITGMAIRKPETMTLKATKAYFENVKGVVSVAYDHIYRLDDPIKPKLEER